MALWRDVLRWSGLAAVAGITLLAPALLLDFGYTHDRFLLLSALVISGWVGAFGIVRNETKWGYLGALGLVVFSFWDVLLQTAAIPAAMLITLGVLATRGMDAETQETE
ncbi:hypothetical protein OB919_17355 [Halobacteria archaeon AArc-curdl1]|uniref:Uncharacterized protein n=1 Tax=Natronosalvus hydrolyticus TaxID=2979988 RepID=A0AAP2ZBA5_9EURY|nr:hypothetical protein [Halobacteria archaeon AArc-curdl1]